MDDPFGEAIYEYFEKGKAPNLTVNTNYTEDEQIPVSYLFRKEKDMPALEITALKLCKGNILDVGAAAGCHSYILQKKGYSVTALEISEKAVEVLKKRGIQKVVQQDILKYSAKKYDTILLLMNGTGIGGTILGLKKLLKHLKTLLNENGQILLDSSDIKYLFEEEDGSLWVDLNNSKYYGEMEYEITYKKSASKFNWLFIDFNSLKKIANEAGFKCGKILEGDHFEYLAQLK
ncbi:MAG: methyltransferase domain-containing protein [Draconibacterium sp.]|nr:methyltransferase domain-containing protein [Draconibacterium sp.]